MIMERVSSVEEDEGPAAKEGVRKKRTMDAPKPQGFFHYEYNLLPDDEDTVKTDVVTFGVAAKIYTDRQEPKVLRTWQDGDQTWVAWTHWSVGGDTLVSGRERTGQWAGTHWSVGRDSGQWAWTHWSVGGDALVSGRGRTQ